MKITAASKNLSTLDRMWDAIVIGAGPAGTFTARELARKGAAVLLVERKRFPRQKVCGACLNTSAIEVLHSAGLDSIAAREGISFDEIRLGLSGREIRLPSSGGVAIPRSVLDSALAEAATKAGVVFFSETQAVLGESSRDSRAVHLTFDGQKTTVNSRVVVVAAGLAGSVLDLDNTFTTKVARHSRIGVGCLVSEFPEVYRKGAIFMALGRAGYVGLTRTCDGLNIAAVFNSKSLKLFGGPARASAAVLLEAGFPEISALESAVWSGTLPLTRHTRPVAQERVFLVGDAAGYVEPFTGQGMAFALDGARSLVPIVLKGIQEWQPLLARQWITEHRRRVSSREWTCKVVASLTRRPWLARSAFEIARILPSLAYTLARHVDKPFLLSHGS